MNNVDLTIILEGLPAEINRKVISYYRTSRDEDCILVDR